MQTKIKGVKEDGTFDIETKSTAALITELIAEFPKLCEADVKHRLDDIRISAEQDETIRRDFARIIRNHHKKSDALNEEPVEYVNDHEEELIHDGIESIKRCVKNKDFETLFTIVKFCKAIAGDKFSIEVLRTEESDD